MLLSKYFFKTIKEIPSDAEIKSHKLLIKGGYIKQISAGIFSYMPIAVRVLQKIEKILREEMNAIDGYEVNLPVVMPASLWSETGRYEAIGEEMLRFTDRSGRKMLLGITHEEAATDLVRYVVNSYKQLPIMLYQIQTKFRDEPRVRGGLIRVREFVMKDAYSFHKNFEDLDKYYEIVHKSYEKIFRRCGLPVISVASDVGMMGGTAAHEFMAITESGEDTIIICEKCDYKANKEVAKTKREYKKEEMLEPEEVFTPNKKTIEEVSTFLNITPERTMKVVIYDCNDSLVMCLIRGDLEINETKLKNYLKTKVLTFAEDQKLLANNIIPGFASPVNVKNIRIIVDESVAYSNNLTTGANKKDYHVKNINFGKDFTSNEIVDISSVTEGEACIKCGAPLKVIRGIEVGNIFKLGTKYSKSMNAKYIDMQSQEQQIVMGCYGIGVGRLMATVIEVLSSEKRIIWPKNIAPFVVELIGIYKETDREIIKKCEEIYHTLVLNNIEVLYDDRMTSAGIKLNDADLIGSPVRIIVGAKYFNQKKVEIIIEDKKPILIEFEKILEYIKEYLTKKIE